MLSIGRKHPINHWILILLAFTPFSYSSASAPAKFDYDRVFNTIIEPYLNIYSERMGKISALAPCERPDLIDQLALMNSPFKKELSEIIIMLIRQEGVNNKTDGFRYYMELSRMLKSFAQGHILANGRTIYTLTAKIVDSHCSSAIDEAVKLIGFNQDNIN